VAVAVDLLLVAVVLVVYFMVHQFLLQLEHNPFKLVLLLAILVQTLHKVLLEIHLILDQ
jgi:hypothetical protein